MRTPHDLALPVHDPQVVVDTRTRTWAARGNPCILDTGVEANAL